RARRRVRPGGALGGHPDGQAALRGRDARGVAGAGGVRQAGGLLRPAGRLRGRAGAAGVVQAVPGLRAGRPAGRRGGGGGGGGPAADERARLAELERVRLEGEQATAQARAAERRQRRRLVLGAAAVLAVAVVGGLSAVLVVQRQANADLAGKNQELADKNT